MEPLPNVMVLATALGWMAAVGRGNLLCRLSFGHRSARSARRAVAASEPARLVDSRWHDNLADRLTRYGAGEPVEFLDIDLDVDRMSSFQRAVLERCRRIGWGRTVTYGSLAAAAGSPRAARAVGHVMATNRFPLVVPCHRVVSAGGALGGFSAPGGLATKRRLLRLEAT